MMGSEKAHVRIPDMTDEGRKMEQDEKKAKDGKQKRRTLRRLVILAAGVLLFEIFIGNYSSVRSLFYEKTDLTQMASLRWGEPGGEDEGCLTAVINGLDMRIDNLYFDLKMPRNAVTEISISLVDEGNQYLYPLPVMEAAGRYPSSFYTNLHPYGKVKRLEIRLRPAQGGGLVLEEDREAAGSAASFGPGGFSLDGIRANVQRPFDLVLPRMLLLFGTGVFWILLGEKSGIWRIRFDPESRRQKLVTAACLCLFLGAGLVLALSNRACVESPWEHHQQYRELAEAILDGHVWVGRQPELMELENPYDTSGLLADQIPYRADYAYYEGNYYVYFGIVPELLFYLPCLALTGRLFPNYLAVYLCFAGFAAAVFGLYREAAERWFPGIPYVLYPVSAGATITFGSFVYLVSRPDLYHVPVMAANMFTAAGLWLWLRGLNRKKGRCAAFAAGSLCMALVAGCRPQQLLFSLTGIPLFGGYFGLGKARGPKTAPETVRAAHPVRTAHPVQAVSREAAPLSREAAPLSREAAPLSREAAPLLREAALLLLPYLLVAAGIMCYNAMRFSSPFDFGAAYSLTNNDMTHRGTNLSRILYGIYAFFLQPPRFEGVFPFLQTSGLENAYMGKMVSEFLYGGILAAQPLCWCLALFPAYRKRIFGGQAAGVLVCALAASFVIGGFDANAAGILQRYTADMAFGIALACGLMLSGLFQAAERGSASFRTGVLFLRAALTAHAVYAFLIVFACADSVNLKNYGRLLYYGAKRLFQM